VSDLQPPTSRRAAREASKAPANVPTSAPLDYDDGAGPRLTRVQRGLIIGAGALVFVMLGIGSVFFGVSVGRNAASNAPAPQPSSPTRATPASVVQPTAIPTCSLDTLASAPALVKLYGSVVETASGNSLYSNNDTTAQRPASVLKVLTAAAALSVLGPTYQITTSVDAGHAPGTIVLVGQGDATLSRVSHSVYAGAPTLALLASKAFAAYNLDPNNAGIPISQVVLDSTYWDPNDNWDTSVPRSEQTGGYLSESTALQVDGDRANPAAQVSPRSTDPVTAAGHAFVTALAALPGGPNASDVTISKGAAENGATVLASVQSQPVSTLIKQMLAQSDNTLAEMLARIVSVKQNLGGTGGSIQQSTTTALGKYGLDTAGLTIEDGSGESDESLITPVFMSKFMSLVSTKALGLQYVAAGIPVVGKYSAKSGVIATAYTLSGYMTAADGTGESFTFFAEGPDITSAAQPALAALANAVYTCGKNLTNN
jgi:D-alanyl-D-alanine carboxypeptidase/D-alanyl-D-alanine-endopeptidase (penicillin-binding protein 4)